MKNWKITAKVAGMRYPFVDWYQAESEDAARELWLVDARREGVPVDKATLTVEEVAEMP